MLASRSACTHARFFCSLTKQHNLIVKQKHNKLKLTHALITYTPANAASCAAGQGVPPCASSLMIVDRSRPNCSAMCDGMKPRSCMSRAMRFSSDDMRAVGGIADTPENNTN